MTLRVTNQSTLEMVQRNISSLSGRMGEIQTQMSTNKRVNNASDDPSAAAAALSARTAINQNEQYSNNIDSAQQWLDATESSLDSLTDLLTKAKVLTLKAANGTWSSSDLEDMSAEMDELLQQALDVGNSDFSGDYLFSGYQVNAVPFTYDDSTSPATVTYNGDSGKMNRTIGTSSEMAVNISGDTLFPDIFATLIDLRDQLAAGDNSNLSTDELEVEFDDVSAAIGAIGSKSNRLSALQERYTTINTDLETVRSNAEDLDYAEAITQYTSLGTAYSAALEAAAQLTQMSLLDYLS